MIIQFKVSKWRLSAILLGLSCFASPGYSSHGMENMSPRLISGYYKNADNLYAPVILKQEDTVKWSVIQNLPKSNHLHQFLNTIDCTGNTCIAGGYFSNRNVSPLPLLLQTTDRGRTWQYIQTIKNLPKMQFSYIQHIQCDKTACFASGSFYTTFPYGDIKPLLLASKDSGLSWQSIDLTKVVPINHEVRNIHCEGNHCIGIAASSEQARPLISRDHGNTWQYVKEISQLPQADETEIASIKCHNNICIAIGNLTIAHKRKPMILSSQDDGDHWSYVENIQNLSTITYGRLADLTFNKNLWIIVGSYSTTGSTEKVIPLILTSNDDGKNWLFTRRIRMSLDKSTRLNTVSCKDDVCVAGGYTLINSEDADGYEMPTLLTSINGGAYWKVSKRIFLPRAKGASISTVHCDVDHCIAIGHYDNVKSGNGHSEAIRMPLLLVTRNQGFSWPFLNIAQLSQVKSGELTAVSKA